MKKQILKCILPLMLIINLFEAYSQTPILKLDDSKNYELYFVYDLPISKSSVAEVIVEEDIDDPEFYLLYPKSKKSTSNKEMLAFDRTFFYSKKTGLTIELDTFWSSIVDDKATIKNLKENWKGKPVKELPSCGFDYAVYIKENDAFINTLWFNTSCKYGGSSWGDFEFEESPFKYLMKKEKLVTAKIQCTSLQQKKDFINDIKQLDNVYFHRFGNSPNFNGRFLLEFRGKKNKRFGEKLRNEITKTYPNEKFKIDLWATYHVWRTFKRITPIEIQCEKSLGDSFKLYKLEREWEPYNIESIEIFFKDISQISSLIEKYTKE